MKVCESWLRKWVNPEVDTDTLVSQLTMAGLEVDTVEAVAGEFTGVVVGHVLTREQHPNADKLSVCTVDVGDDEPLNIVCGAPNVRAGLKVPVATVGAVLPGNFKIKKSKLRGEPSHGMICSAGELSIVGVDDNAKGIMELPADAPVGKDFRDYFMLDDCVIDIELTPNRGDCASIRGIAREVGVLNAASVVVPDIIAPNVESDLVVNAKVKAVEECPHYLCQVIDCINTQAQTPLWMSLLLERSGIRCIHPVVDICNYVMLELGQPLHAFDLAKLHGDVQVRLANNGEKIKLLDEREVKLTTEDLVIADDKSVLAIAGVMGGFESGVADTTTSILLESTYFNPVVISQTARRVGGTDASYRFERGVDYQLQKLALNRAAQLVIEILGGKAGAVSEHKSKEHYPKTSQVLLRRERIFGLLGIEIADDKVEAYFQALDMQIKAVDAGWEVLIPSHRFDINLEADLIEELATYDQDVFVNAVGGLRVRETAVDLAVLLAVISSLRNKPLPEGLVVFGEVGLSGEIRPVPSGQERIKEAVKHGFKQAIVPKANAPKKSPEGFHIYAVDSLGQALGLL